MQQASSDSHVNLFYSILLYSILLYSILLYSILLYFILFTFLSLLLPGDRGSSLILPPAEAARGIMGGMVITPNLLKENDGRF